MTTASPALPMIVVRAAQPSKADLRQKKRQAEAEARRERSARIVRAFLDGKSASQIVRREKVSETTVYRAIHEAGLTYADGGAHVRAAKTADQTPQEIELARLIRRHRHLLPRGFRTARGVIERLPSYPLTTAG